MDIMQSFPSSYLRAGDLQGKTFKMIMKEVVMEDIGDDHKAVLYFQGADKGVVMNKTNASAIADVGAVGARYRISGNRRITRVA